MAGFVSKMSIIAKSAKPNLDSRDFYEMNSKYNTITNRLPSFVVKGDQIDSISSLVSVPLEYQSLISYGILSQSRGKVDKRDTVHKNYHSENTMGFYWKAMDALNSETGMNFSDITSEIDTHHMAVTSEPKSNKMVVMFQKRGLDNIYHSVIDTTRSILRTIQLVLRKIGIFISVFFGFFDYIGSG